MLDGMLAKVSVRPLLIDPEDAAGAIADVERTVGAERQSARDTEIRRHHLVPAIIEHAIDTAFEAARHIQQSVGTEHHRGRIDQAVHERLARAVAGDAEDRDRRFLPARAAVGDVEIAVGAEHRIVDLMQAGGEQACRPAHTAWRREATPLSPASRRHRGRAARPRPCDRARQTPCAPDTPPIVTRSAVDSGSGKPSPRSHSRPPSTTRTGSRLVSTGTRSARRLCRARGSSTGSRASFRARCAVRS